MAVFIRPHVFHPDDMRVFDIFVDHVEYTSRIVVKGLTSFQEDLHDLVTLTWLCSQLINECIVVVHRLMIPLPGDFEQMFRGAYRQECSI